MKAYQGIGIACTLAALVLLRRPVRYSLNGKVAVITGGSRGLGLALAQRVCAPRHETRAAGP